ncbi:MAG: CHAP domain-containing protein [Novosphingobium sp.]|nr:MAG: CHAP domain-containing protein [Novosphingobium sp.]
MALSCGYAAPLAASEMARRSAGEMASTSSGARLQCVPYARRISGIAIYGDAHTWWDQSAGRYDRGFRPRVGAVMVLPSHGKMQLGHVAAVSRIIDARTILLRHANWSPIDGARGQIEDDVPAVDVSPNNDWSRVRVWFAPLQFLGATHWPVQGFIYNRKPARLVRMSDPIGDIIARVTRTGTIPRPVPYGFAVDKTIKKKAM